MSVTWFLRAVPFMYDPVGGVSFMCDLDRFIYLFHGFRSHLDEDLFIF